MGKSEVRWAAAAAGAAFLATVIAHSPVLHNGFVNWDDESTIVGNPHFLGLGAAELRWMFTSMEFTIYQPLSWLTIALIFAAVGPGPWGLHAANVLLHGLNAALLCWLTWRLLGWRGAPRPAARAAASLVSTLLFSIHPLQVEATAMALMVCDLPPILMGLAAAHCYLYYGGRPERRGWLTASWALPAASVLFHWQCIFLPIAFLALDAYPLRRWPGPLKPILAEKIPHFLVSAAIFAITALPKIFVSGFNTVGGDPAGAAARILFYLEKIVIPTGFMPVYFLDGKAAHLAGAAALTAAAVAARKRWPGLLTAWVCYLAALAPTLGFANRDGLVVNDRYAYHAVPALFAALGGGLHAAWIRGGLYRIFPAAAAAAVPALAALTWRQAQVWQDSQTLWRHVLTVDPASAVARSRIGLDYLGEGRTDEAIAWFRDALAVQPRSAETHYNLGVALERLGRLSEAASHYEKAHRIRPALLQARNNLGVAWARMGRLDEAERLFAERLQEAPGDADAARNLEWARSLRPAPRR